MCASPAAAPRRASRRERPVRTGRHDRAGSRPGSRRRAGSRESPASPEAKSLSSSRRSSGMLSATYAATASTCAPRAGPEAPATLHRPAGDSAAEVDDRDPFGSHVRDGKGIPGASGGSHHREPPAGGHRPRRRRRGQRRRASSRGRAQNPGSRGDPATRAGPRGAKPAGGATGPRSPTGAFRAGRERRDASRSARLTGHQPQVEPRGSVLLARRGRFGGGTQPPVHEGQLTLDPAHGHEQRPLVPAPSAPELDPVETAAGGECRPQRKPHGGVAHRRPIGTRARRLDPASTCLGSGRLEADDGARTRDTWLGKLVPGRGRTETSADERAQPCGFAAGRASRSALRAGLGSRTFGPGLARGYVARNRLAFTPSRPVSSFARSPLTRARDRSSRPARAGVRRSLGG